MKYLIRNIYHSFPIQLLKIQLRSNQIFLLFWLLVFSMVPGAIGKTFGTKYLFLAPEYFGQVNFWSFALVGFCFSAFLMSWNIAMYILHSNKFPFLASLDRPFAKFVLNNSLLPLLFLIFYIYNIITFQWYSEFAAKKTIFILCAGFVAGMILGLIIATAYFSNTNHDVISFQKLKIKIPDLPDLLEKLVPDEKIKDDFYRDAVQVDYYLNERLLPKHTRTVKHYDAKILHDVFRQNHSNALLIQIISVFFIILTAIFIDVKIFRIPAGASIFLLLAILSALGGAMTYWLQGWRTSVLLALLFIVNYITTYDFFYIENKAFGINYELPKTPYTNEKLDSIATLENYKEDYQASLQILQNWRKRFGESLLLRKPKLVVICVSGGGLRSATWVTNVIQEIEQNLKGRFLDHTVLITGASGGMLGAAYMRELHYLKKIGKLKNVSDETYFNNISKDILNSIIFTMVTNDMFVPFVKFRYNGHKYLKDRGYSFEQQLIENLGGLLNHDLKFYKDLEQKALMPMMFLTPVMNFGGKQLLISPQKLTYMMKTELGFHDTLAAEIDMIDMGRFLEKHQPYNMRFTTALRTNATYPYILPNVHLPTEPSLELSDAGFRDNYGFAPASRFLLVFRNWIQQNTDGVVIVQIRDKEKKDEIESYRRSFLSTLFSPLGNLVEVSGFQDYVHDNYLEHLITVFGMDKINIVRFTYRPQEKSKRVSVSFHLTTREKKDIKNAIYNQDNQESMRQLKNLIR